jgi:hypothetical protein
VRLTVAALAARSGLAQGTINRAESVDGDAPITTANARLLVQTLADAGVIFVVADEYGGEGVRRRPKDIENR